jgi:hypothetical protein
MEVILNENYVFIAGVVFVGVILIASFILDKLENETE